MSITPNMGMLLPTVSLTPGPLYADENNQAFAVIDAHNHTPGNGSPIPSNGISINQDLAFNNFNATLLRSTRFTDQVSPLALITDVGCLYIAGGNLYYNNQIGQQVQITAGAALNATSIGGIGGDYVTSTASVFYTSAVSTFYFWQAANTPAFLDIGPITIRNDTLNSFGISIAPPLTLSANMSLTLFGSLPASTKILTVDNVGQIAAAYDVDNSTISVIANIIQVPTGGITTTQIASNTIVDGNISPTADIQGSKMLDASISVTKQVARPFVYPTAAIDEVAIADSSGTYTTTSTTYVAVTNQLLNITTSGRPVSISFIPVASAAPSYLGVSGSIVGIEVVAASFTIYRDGVAMYENIIDQRTAAATTPQNSQQLIPPGCINIIDDVPAGTYEYRLLVKANASNNTVSVNNTRMVVYEI
jgi:hypothetical protein